MPVHGESSAIAAVAKINAIRNTLGKREPGPIASQPFYIAQATRFARLVG